MKKAHQVVCLLMIGLLTGCTRITPTPFPTFSENVAVEEKNDSKGQEVIEASLKMFFKAYFSLSEEDVLMLNQNPQQIDSDYWDIYTNHKEKLIGLIGDFLAPDAKAKLKKQYLTYDFHLPKKLKINEYITLGPGTIEEVHIIDSRVSGENIIYQTAVTMRAQAEPLSEANKKYLWESSKLYYVKAENQQLNHFTFDSDQLTSKDSENSYLYPRRDTENEADEIKLIQRYWVEVKPGDKLQIKSVKEATTLAVNEETRQLASNTKHIDRVPYWKEASAKDQSLVKTVITKLMQQPKDFYTYYEKAFNTHFDIFKTVWDKDLELENKVFISEDDYQEAFNILINPYKDTVRTLELDDTKMTIAPSIYATKKQPRYIVYVPVKAMLNNNETAYYTYKYYVGLEQNKIEFIQFMNRELLTEETYLNNTSSEAETKLDSETAQGA